MSSGVFLFIFISGVFSVPLLFSIKQIGFNPSYFSIFLTALLSIIAVYFVANVQQESIKESYAKTVLKFILIFPVFLSLSMGLSLHNTIAVIQGYLGKKSPFIRTPKFNIKGIKDSFQSRKYMATKLPVTTIFEGLLAIYFVIGVILGLHYENTTFVIFHILLAFGFGTICFYSIRHFRLK